MLGLALDCVGVVHVAEYLEHVGYKPVGVDGGKADGFVTVREHFLRRIDRERHAALDVGTVACFPKAA